MVSQAAMKELRMFLDDDSLEGIKKKTRQVVCYVDSTNLDSDLINAHDQLLIGHEVPSEDNLTADRLCVHNK